ncbi:MetQ/NlpA family ABC transporter substrate-binding protein [Bacillus sp. Hm123]|uniref:MetQ/NlpA family ABC transporter substrate-binding protein n=1 Tax=Bacillus sp. Hm123 TaxID=3450745 RepID=UPI003F42AB81
MKKWLFALLTSLVVLALAACGGSEEKKEEGKSEENKKLVVGASNVPHAIILEEAKPLLEAKGYELEIETFNDYILPNKALDEGELDANYYQHIPFLELQKKEHGYKFENAGGIHIEPIGVYSKKYKSLDELSKGAKVLMSSSVADHGRVLSLLEKEGLIKLKDGINKTDATLEDVSENKKDLQFEYNYEPAFLPQAFNNGEGDIVVINSNFAIDSGLDPLKDPIVIESNDSPYVNIVAVRSGDEENEKIKALIDALHSQEIQDFIMNEWKGAIVPVNE